MVNESKISPVEYKILILPDTVEEMMASGLWVPETAREKEQLGQVVGTLVAVGGNTFSDWGDGRKPKVGDRVYFAKYAGYVIKGKDRREYRIANDKDIAAIIEE